MDHAFYRFWWLTTLQRWVFACCWRLFLLLYVSIGVGALAVVFWIETRFFGQLTHDPALSYLIAGILECAKVGTSVVKQVLTIAKKVSRVKVSALLQGLTVIFQIALIVLSLICSVMVVASYLDDAAEPLAQSFLPQKQTRTSGRYPETFSAAHPIVRSAVALLRDSFGIEANPSVCISVFALLLSGLLQSTIYIVFGHVLATQAHEIEYLFIVKVEKTDAKKNCMVNT
jgi:hypothetical protein